MIKVISPGVRHHKLSISANIDLPKITSMKNIVLIIFAALFTIGAKATPQTIYGQEVVITNTVENDLYISAGNVRIEAPVLGDVLVCGGNVTISSKVSGSIFVLGGELVFSGWVDGSLRCASGKVHVSGTVMKDMVIASGEVVCDKSSLINGSILAAGGKLSIDGLVKQDVQSYATTTSIEGHVEGELNCKGESLYINNTIGRQAKLAANDIQIGENAAFQDRVNYWDSDGEVDFKGSMFDRKPVFDQSLEIKQDNLDVIGLTTSLYLIWYLLAGLCAIILFQYLLKRFLKISADKKNALTAKSIGYGILFMIALPSAIVLAIITLIGIPIGILLTTLLLILTLFNSILLSVFLSNWVNNKYNRHWGNNKVIVFAFLLFITLKVITTIPFIGWLIIFFLTAAMFGAIIRNNILKERRQPALIKAKN
jgi:cytoskeletal protein CcmA (bactofilin family)